MVFFSLSLSFCLRLIFSNFVTALVLCYKDVRFLLLQLNGDLPMWGNKDEGGFLLVGVGKGHYLVKSLVLANEADYLLLKGFLWLKLVKNSLSELRWT